MELRSARRPLSAILQSQRRRARNLREGDDGRRELDDGEEALVAGKIDAPVAARRGLELQLQVTFAPRSNANSRRRESGMSSTWSTSCWRKTKKISNGTLLLGTLHPRKLRLQHTLKTPWKIMQILEMADNSICTELMPPPPPPMPYMSSKNRKRNSYWR